jgi:serine protease Do
MQPRRREGTKARQYLEIDRQIAHDHRRPWASSAPPLLLMSGTARRTTGGRENEQMRSPRKQVLALVTVAATLAVPPPAAAQTSSAVSRLAEVSRALEETARSTSGAVVQIFATAFRTGDGLVPRAGDLVTTERAVGSGVIVDADGYIVTNAHVVLGAWRLRVEVPLAPAGASILSARSRSVNAEIIGLDAETDLAVIKVDERGLAALPFGDSDELKPGQLVMAVGSPSGLHNSVTLGVVSAVGRQLEPESPMIYVQTDASINPGSSGGPLVDMSGRLVGINTLIVSRAGGDDGLGFAAPSNIVRTVYEQIRASGRVRRGDIGVRAQTVTPTLAAGLALPRTTGAILSDVLPASPAFRAGLRRGDIVLAVGGKPIENGRQLQVNLYRHTIGEVVTMDILRAGSPATVKVVMGERDDPLARLSASVDPRRNLVPRLGILGMNFDHTVAPLLPAARVKSGVVVASMVSGAIDSREGGLTPGDIVFGVNLSPVGDLAQLRALVDALRTGDPVVLQLDRRGVLMYLPFTAE